MPRYDCDSCKTIRCNGESVGPEKYRTLISRLMCQIAEDSALFDPLFSGGQTLDVTQAGEQLTLSEEGTRIRITNLGTSPVYVRWGEGSQVAVVNADLTIRQNATLIFRREPGETGFGAICATGETATLKVILGNP